MIFHGGFQKHVALPSTLWEPWSSLEQHQKNTTKRKKFLGIPKSFGITSSMLYGRKLLVSHPRLNPPMGFLNACSRKCILLGEAYILIHTYNVHSGRLSQFCPHLFNSGGLVGLLNRFGPWKLEVK